jgi:hypothetical protein
MKPASDMPKSSPACCDPLPGPPAPTGDAFIDEVRAIKYELSSRFDHDIERLGAHLKAVQEDIARHDPQRVIRHPARRPSG